MNAMGRLCPILGGMAVLAVSFFGFSSTATAAELMSGNGVDATAVYDNIRTVLPFVAVTAVLLTICVVVWLPRFTNLALTAMVLTLLGNFAPQAIALLTGDTTGGQSIAQGAELFAPAQVQLVTVQERHGRG